MESLLHSDVMIYALAAASGILIVEALYLLFHSSGSYRKNVNRRLQIASNDMSRENVLIQLRRERGLTVEGSLRLPLIALNLLILQSGINMGLLRLGLYATIAGLGAFGAMLAIKGDIMFAALAAFACGVVLPYFVLSMARGRRRKAFGVQFADALDIVVRSLRAGHPVPVAIAMVAREMRDPIGTEFGMAADEITYGSDVETAMRNLYARVGQEDLPLFITAVSIQGSTGGNLAEILIKLSAVIRDRIKMRRKVRALTAEGRMSAIILSSLPIVTFAILYVITPGFYGEVWHIELTKTGLGLAGGWMAVGNYAMYRMVNFKI